MNRVVKILMERDGVTVEDAEDIRTGIITDIINDLSSEYPLNKGYDFDVKTCYKIIDYKCKRPLDFKIDVINGILTIDNKKTERVVFPYYNTTPKVNNNIKDYEDAILARQES